MDIIPNKGERAVIVGQTGSGKTRAAVWLMQQIELAPVYILDTKGEPAFNAIAQGDETLTIYNNGSAFVKSLDAKQQPTYSIVRPTPDEMSEPLEMDAILMSIYNRNKACVIYIDEAYQWHVNGRCGAGLIALLTRGRSKGMTTLLSTQRPAWISRFCFSEAQKFYVFRLSDNRDLKTIAEFIPTFSDNKVVTPYHWWYYDASQEEPFYFSPVPIDKSPVLLTTNRWI